MKTQIKIIQFELSLAINIGSSHFMQIQKNKHHFDIETRDETV